MRALYPSAFSEAPTKATPRGLNSRSSEPDVATGERAREVMLLLGAVPELRRRESLAVAQHHCRADPARNQNRLLQDLAAGDVRTDAVRPGDDVRLVQPLARGPADRQQRGGGADIVALVGGRQEFELLEGAREPIVAIEHHRQLATGHPAQ